MRKLKQTLLVSAAIMSIGGAISSQASDDRSNFATATSTLVIPKLNIDGVNTLNSVEIKFNFATQTFSVEGFEPVSLSSIKLEQLSDTSYSFNAVAGQSYVVEIFNVARGLGENRGSTCDGYSKSGLGLKIKDPLSTVIASSCEPNGAGNVHNFVAFNAGLDGQFQIDIVSNMASADLLEKYSIRVQPKYDNPSIVWDANFEPNNIGLNAVPIDLGASNALTSNIEGRNSSFATNQVDFDWYQFNANPEENYLVEIYDVINLLGVERGSNCDGYTKSGVGLKITDSLFTEIASSCEPNGTGNVHNRVVVKSGIGGALHIGVIPNSKMTQGSYKLRVLPLHDDPASSWDAGLEPNNHPISAFLIPLGDTLTSQIEDRNSSYDTNSPDLDYYRFEGTASQTYKVELLDVSSTSPCK